MKIIHILCLILASQSFVAAQVLIPYLGENGKYGYATQDGRAIIEPKYDALEPMNEAQFYTNCRLDNQPVLLLRNGKTLSSNGFSNLGIVLNNLWDTNSDTIEGVYSLWKDNQSTLIDFRGDSSISYLLPKHEWPNWWFKEKGLDGNGIPRFVHGLCKVLQPSGKYNFIDTDFKLIFKEDFFEGMVVDSNYLFIADENKKIAIANRSGRMLTPFQWDKIEKSGKSGFFIVNNSHDLFNPSKNAGCIDTSGKIIIDTVYAFIRYSNNETLLKVEKDKKNGLFDYNGNIVYPLGPKTISQTHDDSLFIVAWEYRKYNIEDLMGRKLLPEDVDYVSLEKVGGYSFYVIVEGRKNIVLDTNFQKKTVIRLRETYFEEGHEKQLIIGDEDCWKANMRLYDENLKLVSRRRYSKIEKFSNSRYIVSKYGLFGMIDSRGKTIIPAKFYQYHMENPTSDSSIIWCLPLISRKWSAFNIKGEKLQLSKRKQPKPKQPESYPIKGNGDDRTITLSNGKVIPLPGYLKGLHSSLNPIKTPNGKISIWAKSFNDNLEGAVVVNEKYENLLPQGGFLLKEHALNWYDRIAKTGLITVYQKLPSAEIASNNSKQDSVRCGVMDAKGDYVLPLKTGVRYVPMSPALVAELPYEDTQNLSAVREKAFVIHQIKRPVSEPIIINYTAHHLFDEKYNVFLFGKIDSNTKQLLKAYFNSNGKQITPFNILEGPGWLSKINLVTKYEEDGIIQQVLMDDSGKVIFGLGHYFHAMPKIQPFHMTNIGHLPVFDATKLPEGVLDHKKTYTNEDLFDMAEKHGLFQGLIDSTGSIVLPFKYKQLKEIKRGHLFSAVGENGLTQIIGIDGHRIHEFGSGNAIRYFQLSTNETLLTAGEETILLSSEYSTLMEYPYACYSIKYSPNFEKNYFTSKDENGKEFWVNISTGMPFKRTK